MTAPNLLQPRRTMIWRFLQAFCVMMLRVLYDFRVTGRHHVPTTGGVLVVCNHQSYLDPILLGARLWRPMAYLAEAHLFKFKPFAWLIRSLNAFPIQQGKGDIGAMKESIRLLHAGQILNVFPEGTRTEDGKLQPVLGGVAVLIRRAKVPVVPAIITGAYQAWPRHQRLPHPGRIRLHFGEPMHLDGLTSDQIVRTIEETFARMLAEAEARG